MTRALLFSNSANYNGGFLTHARDVVSDFFTDTKEVLFAPWALADHDAYTSQVAFGFRDHGIRLRGLHTLDDPVGAIGDSEALFVGGGNTFRLVSKLHQMGLMSVIRDAVDRGLRYSGASAGSLIASPTMRTTNDMPIVEPPSLQTLGLLPFQLNCHYVDADPNSTHAGESRELRIREFHEENDVAVLGIREGTWLRLDDAPGTARAYLSGTPVSVTALGPGVLHMRNSPPREVSGDVSALFDGMTRFGT